ncbi:FXSXX-COOH protein [Streptomyces sp. yr375]|uniref:FxSxx-COOH cyclophane-containing RiPP peptide n=1 Tax=Streptomyces sp. yr375 TaxID=1761906 RepID=UPI0008B52C1E|nr:FxSxx-COOH cyclophane-containing RiPP peptide [Streptomyces sp. yr375]SES36646.1 FXSXX-COOH protein [Streptomyces sp. yr375]
MANGMDAHVEPTADTEVTGDLPDLSELLDLTALGLAELGSIRHPLLQEVLADLRERAKRPSEVLWGFSSSF